MLHIVSVDSVAESARIGAAGELLGQRQGSLGCTDLAALL